MDCRQAQERMWHCLDRRNADTGLQHHLAGCTDCHQLWQEMKLFEDQLHTLRLDRPSDRFVDSVMGAVKQEKVYSEHDGKKSKWTTWNHLWIASAATFGLLMMGGKSVVDSGELSSITIYALRLSWKMTEIAGHIPHLF